MDEDGAPELCGSALGGAVLDDAAEATVSAVVFSLLLQPMPRVGRVVWHKVLLT